MSHTRFLHSWSLGSCIVAFEDSSVSIPEIEHNKNVLLARDSHEIAEHIITASQDNKIRRKLGAGGIATLKKSFDAKIVANKIIAKINAD